MADVLLVLIFLGPVNAASGWAFTLTTPIEGTTLQSGESIPVDVRVPQGLTLREVRFYWYRIDEEPVASHQASPARLTRSEGGTPFGGTIQVPIDAIGTMRLLVVGEVVRGRLESYEEFDEVLVNVAPAAPLVSIEFAVQQPWRLDVIGKLVTIPVVGHFEDGVMRSLVGKEAGSRFRSSDERVVKVDDSGVLEVTGNGRARVTVENRGRAGTVEVVVEADTQPNRPPVAHVADELHVRSGSLVVLNGLGSRDPDGDPLRYRWRQLRGHRVGLMNADEVKAAFVAPKVSARRLYEFSLTVTDMSGPDTVKGADSRPATVSVWVAP
jgi:hypothetical protein